MVNSLYPINWQEKKLGELVTFQRGFDLPKNDFKPGEYSVMGSNGLIGKHNEYKSRGPGITIGRSGNLGKPYYIENNYWPHNTTLFSLRFHNSHPKFIYYLLKKIRLNKFNAGSAVPTLNRNHIHPIKVVVPKDINEQKKIAEILSSLDKKIELNNKANAILEQISQLLFKHWFVDFEFPNKQIQPYKSSGEEFIDSELGKIPKGWEAGKFKDLLKEKTDRARKTDSYLKVFSVINSGNIVLSDDFFNKMVYSKDLSNYKIVNLKEFAFNPARINIGSIGMNEFAYPGAISPMYIVFKTKTEYEHFFQILIKTNKIKNIIKQLCSGTVRQTITFKDFSSVDTIIPDLETIKKFNNIYLGLKNLIDFNNSQNQALINIRDILLPKLITGKIRVNLEDIEES